MREKSIIDKRQKITVQTIEHLNSNAIIIKMVMSIIIKIIEVMKVVIVIRFLG